MKDNFQREQSDRYTESGGGLLVFLDNAAEVLHNITGGGEGYIF